MQLVMCGQKRDRAVLALTWEIFSGGSFSNSVFSKGCFSAEHTEQEEKQNMHKQCKGESKFSPPNVICFCWNEISVITLFLDINERFLAVLEAWRTLQCQFVSTVTFLSLVRHNTAPSLSAFYQRKICGQFPPRAMNIQIDNRTLLAIIFEESNSTHTELILTCAILWFFLYHCCAHLFLCNISFF